MDSGTWAGPFPVDAIVNAHREAVDFGRPPAAPGPSNPWRRWIDTFLASHDIVPWPTAPLVPGADPSQSGRLGS